jgi:hypothetical protein
MCFIYAEVLTSTIAIVQDYVNSGTAKQVFVEHVCTCVGALNQCSPSTKCLETTHPEKPVVCVVLQYTDRLTGHKVNTALRFTTY